jgi:CheY-like chemotaxis protein
MTTTDHSVTTILLVEDDDAHAQLIEANLRRGGLGNPIERFDNGQAVLNFLNCEGDFLGRERPESLIMLLDLNMPGIDGGQVLAAVKSDASLRKMPVIVLTSTDEPGEIENAYERGCNAYVTKPVRYDQFVGTIQRLGQFVTLLAVPRGGC